MGQKNCIFCSIAKDEITSATIYETNEFKVILDAFPSGRGHTLVITKEHYENIYELDADTAGKFFALVTVVARALKKVTKCEALNVLQNNGKLAGQTVNHFHMHLIPRFEGDGIHFGWKTQQLAPEDMQALAKEINSKI